MAKRRVKTTLKKFRRFLRYGQQEVVKKNVMNKIEPVLRKTLKNKVFTKHPDPETYHIPDISTLKHRMLSSNFAADGKPYNEEYEKRKIDIGETTAHKWGNYAFWDGTQVINWVDKVEVRATQPTVKPGGVLEKQYRGGTPTSTKKFNYMAHHEERRSVIKATWLLSWKDIVDIIELEYINAIK